MQPFDEDLAHYLSHGKVSSLYLQDGDGYGDGNSWYYNTSPRRTGDGDKTNEDKAPEHIWGYWTTSQYGSLVFPKPHQVKAGVSYGPNTNHSN